MNLKAPHTEMLKWSRHKILTYALCFIWSNVHWNAISFLLIDTTRREPCCFVCQILAEYQNPGLVLRKRKWWDMLIVLVDCYRSTFLAFTVL